MADTLGPSSGIPNLLDRLSRVTELGGLNTRISPFDGQEGEFFRLVNVDSYPVGAKRKRPGYVTLLGTADGSAVSNLFDWHQDDGTTFWLYRASGSSLWYSTQGTGAWTLCGNGTITAGSYVGHAILNNTLVIGDGVGSTRHSTNGTSFTNTMGAPIAQYFENYQNRIYAAGTSNTLVYGVTGDPTNWQTTGTSDGNSFTVPGPGRLSGIMKVADRIITIKNTGMMHRWDGFNLYDLSTILGPTSYLSIGSIQDFRIYGNRRGYYGFEGNAPQILSNPIQSQVYNDMGSAIAGGTFNLMPATIHKYQYSCAVGTVTDDITGETINNAFQNYNYQLNEWSNYAMGTPITALWDYKDGNFNEQLIMGDSGGQCYTFGGTALNDNGLPIESIMEYVFHGGVPEHLKEFNWAWFFFNPGCQARVQVAVGDTWTREKLKWQDLGDMSDGIGEHHFHKERGRLLFVKIVESSRNTRFTFYGMAVQYHIIPRT